MPINKIQKVRSNILFKKNEYVRLQKYEVAAIWHDLEKELKKIIYNNEELECFLEKFQSTYGKFINFDELYKEIAPLYGVLRKIKLQKIEKSRYENKIKC